VRLPLRLRGKAMSVRVDDLTSDVTAESEPHDTSGSDSSGAWEAEDRYRELRDRMARDAERTRAEAYDD
ncbi:MAG: hypothetical protein M3540_12170, partial [Actinomycetota bacterium]|nr:hypothetical protein [Actinomycetota bacterium]